MIRLTRTIIVLMCFFLSSCAIIDTPGGLRPAIDWNAVKSAGVVLVTPCLPRDYACYAYYGFASPATPPAVIIQQPRTTVAIPPPPPPGCSVVDTSGQTIAGVRVKNQDTGEVGCKVGETIYLVKTPAQIQHDKDQEKIRLLEQKLDQKFKTQIEK